MKRFLSILIFLCVAWCGIYAEDTNAASTKPAKKETVVLSCDLHCKACCDKVLFNIAWEKGVRDLVCDLKSKTVTVTYDPRKTTLDSILSAFDRIGKPATPLPKQK